MFTSNLSVSEFVLAGKEEVVPRGQVMGNSVYSFDLNVAQQRLGTGEIKPLTRPLLDVYLQALARLQRGAQLLGADTVIGLRLEEARKFPTLWRPKNVLTVKAVGTAVNLGAGECPATPVLAAVTGQEYYALRRAGLLPVGLVLGQSVYFQVSQGAALFSAMPHDASLLDFARINSSIERTDYTRAVTKARRLALGRMEGEAQHRQAEGVLGVSVKMRHSWLQSGLVVECMAMGTAVVCRGRPGGAVQASVPLTG